LHDPPYSPDDAAAQHEARRFGETLRELLRADRPAEALELWFRTTGMPDEIMQGMRATPRWAELTALASTLAYDSAVMGDIDRGGAVPEDIASRAARPGLVLVGGESPPFMLEVGRRLAQLLPDARHRVLDGQDHVVPPDILTPAVTEFLAG
jgi:pimeloyl-ACP methyl ester carboxylesterase